MPDMTPAPRRRPLWRLFIMPALLVVAAAAWSAFWFYAASEVGVRADAWAAQEAKSGRVYACGKREVAGFPFRFEVRCDDASVALVSQTAGAQAAFTARLGEIMVIAQIYQPKLLIAEFKAPATLADRGQPPSLKVNWTTGRSSVSGLPDIPQRASIVFDNPSIDRINGPVQTPLARAGRAELHGRFAEGSAKDQPVIETVLQISGGSVQELHPLLGRAVRRQRGDQAEWVEGFLAKALAGTVQGNPGGRRPCRDRAVAGSAGRFGLGGRRHVEPQRAGADRRRIADDGGGHREKRSPRWGSKRCWRRACRRQRSIASPRASSRRTSTTCLARSTVRSRASARSSSRTPMPASPQASTRSARRRNSTEKKARAFPLRFVDGAVFLGPLKVGQVPPLF